MFIKIMRIVSVLDCIVNFCLENTNSNKDSWRWKSGSCAVHGKVPLTGIDSMRKSKEEKIRGEYFRYHPTTRCVEHSDINLKICHPDVPYKALKTPFYFEYCGSRYIR